MNIPVVDVSAYKYAGASCQTAVVDDVRVAAEDWGCFFVQAHGIDPNVISALRNAQMAFFSLPNERKQRCLFSRSRRGGFIPLSVVRSRVEADKPDHCKAYKIHQVPCIADDEAQFCTIWPDDVPSFAEAVRAYWELAERLGALILEVLAVSLSISPEHFRTAFNPSLNNMSLVHYPPAPQTHEVYGIHPHIDSDALTLLLPDPAGGLQIETNNGQWIECTGPSDSILVNIGQLLTIWSGGRFMSRKHCVINLVNRSRYSIPFFMAPGPGVLVCPLITPRPGFRIHNVKVSNIPEYAQFYRTADR